MHESSLGLHLTAITGFPRYGGAVTAVASWDPPSELRSLIGGDRVHLACWVHAPDGTVLVEGGPRSAPLHLSPGLMQPIAVPLVVPAAVGHYRLALDAVVEHRFWASWHGIARYPLEVERATDGDVVITDAATGVQVELGASAPFSIPGPMYGLQANERAVEIPWVLSELHRALGEGARRVVDVGYAYAEGAYLEGLADLPIPELFGIDLATRDVPHLHSYVADVRRPAIRPHSVDVVLAVSVLEHIGRDNSVYPTHHIDLRSKNGDLHAVRELADLLAPAGRIILTVPYGKAEDQGWFVQFDRRRLRRLIRASRLSVCRLEYFAYDRGWHGPVDPDLLSVRRYQENAAAASAIACLVLR